ncbi:MAG: ABC transporter ATP-binding protein [Candidatus Zixiibacteriota bacterium]|nr:MAG: ABC transporter ATP-binding protein [candidate division Zixibacteria bacterium]
MTAYSEKSTQIKPRFSTVTKYLLQYRRYLVVGGLAVIMANALILVVPYVSKLVFDALEAGQPDSVILKYVVLAFALALLSGVFRFTMRRTIIWMSRHIEYDLRGEIFAHLLRLSPPFYHVNRTGDLMARMTNDLEAVRQMIGPGIMYISDTIVKLIVSFAVMIYLSPRLTGYAVIPLIILPLAVNKIGNLLHRRSMRVQEKFSELTATAQENLSGIRVVKAYEQEEREIEYFGRLSTEYIGLNMALAKLQGLFMPSMRLLASISYLIVFYFGGLGIIRNELSLGDIVAFFAYLAMILWPMVAIGWVTSLYQRGKASLERINRVLFTQPEVSDGDELKYDQPMCGAIEFRNLSFAYNGHQVLKNINLKVDSGQTVGLVGMTGSGKTTLVSILARLYAVERGKVFIDDVDINDWKLSSLRRQIGFATQEPFLFSDTLRENIRFGRDGIEADSIEKAAGIAALAKDVESFRDRYETIVGERGITLSGGQKQRTAIARAILGKPRILIFDDVTSAVDTETEHQINERIKQVLTQRTSIIISHRVSSVKDADFILYLEDGKIAEQGSHEELLKLNGSYAELYRSQLLEMELEQL